MTSFNELSTLLGLLVIADTSFYASCSTVLKPMDFKRNVYNDSCIMISASASTFMSFCGLYSASDTVYQSMSTLRSDLSQVITVVIEVFHFHDTKQDQKIFCLLKHWIAVRIHNDSNASSIVRINVSAFRRRIGNLLN